MSISRKLRFKVLMRDGFCCVYCGRRPPAVTLEVDHRIPRSKGGEDVLENLVCACWDCNRSKGPNELVSDPPDWDTWKRRQESEGEYEMLPDELPKWMLARPGTYSR